MPPYCISSVFSRRDFLKWVLAMAGLMAFPKTEGLAAVGKMATWHEPVWIWNLTSGKRMGPVSWGPVPDGRPGSVMKLITAAALLEDRLIAPEQAFSCTGRIKLQGQSYVCQHAHGTVAMEEAIGVSCNVFFAQAVQRLSRRRLFHYARRFQLDRSLNSDEPFRFISTQAQQSIQQLALGLSPDIQPNAWQLLRVAKIIAGCEIAEFRPNTWKILQGGMRLAVRNGTAQALDPADFYRLAAKTGTVPHGDRFDSWLIGYFPVEKPRLAFCARAFAGTAKESAVPLLRQFLAEHQGL